MLELDLGRGDLLTGESGTYAIRSLIDRGGVGAVYDAQRIKDRGARRPCDRGWRHTTRFCRPEVAGASIPSIHCSCHQDAAYNSAEVL